MRNGSNGGQHVQEDRFDAVRSCLRTARPFSDLDPAIIEHLVHRSRSKDLPQGHAVFRESDACLDLHILAHGQIRCYRANQDGRELVIRTIQRPNEVFCLAAMFAHNGHLFTAQTTVPTRLFYFPVAIVKDLARTHSSVAMALLLVATEQTSSLMDLAENLALKKVVARVAMVLRQMALLDGKRNGTEFLLDRSRCRVEALASNVGTVRVHMARSLNQLARMGAIKINRRNIIVRDIGLLDQIARDCPGDRL